METNGPSAAGTSAAAKTRGRPRSFDRDAALDAAMMLFWRQGFAPTSIADLTTAMGISPPSLYAAFGDKEQLFLEAVERYQGDADRSADALLAAAPSARAGIEQLLRSAAARLSCKDGPAGCMVVTAAMNCSSDCGHLQRLLAERRTRGLERIAARLEEAVSLGELAPYTDAPALASFYDTVMQGMSIQARDGATHAQLLAITTTAMRAWPSH